MQYRKHFIHADGILQTIYFGGGTPSVLSVNEIHTILSEIARHFAIADKAEITLEANPDDIQPAYLRGLSEAGVNRLSLGVQSLQDHVLQTMNRRHTAHEAWEAAVMALDAGFTNLSLDMMYGIPGLDTPTLQKDLRRLFTLPFPHLSAYMLGIESGTVFSHLVQKGCLIEIGEEEAFTQFKVLINEAKRAGFEQYEISNFARQHHYSRHNTAYWQQESYLGLGPSAHSFNGQIRTWNVRSLPTYLDACFSGQPAFEEEQPGFLTRYNEYMLTTLRTKWGINPENLGQQFGQECLDLCMKRIQAYIASGDMVQHEQIYRLTEKGMFISDYIIEDFFLV